MRPDQERALHGLHVGAEDYRMVKDASPVCLDKFIEARAARVGWGEGLPSWFRVTPEVAIGMLKQPGGPATRLAEVEAFEAACEDQETAYLALREAGVPHSGFEIRDPPSEAMAARLELAEQAGYQMTEDDRQFVWEELHGLGPSPQEALAAAGVTLRTGVTPGWPVEPGSPSPAEALAAAEVPMRSRFHNPGQDRHR